MAPPSRRLQLLASHVAAGWGPTGQAGGLPRALPAAASLAGKRVVFCGFCQEVSTFNPVPSTREDFVHLRGPEIVTGECAGFGYIKAAVPVLAAAGVAAVGTYDFTAAANGVLDHGEFMAMAAELLQSVRAAAAAGPVDGVFFHLHGAGQTSEDNDPEGYLLAEVRKIIGAGVPMVANFDLHGIITEKMMGELNGLAVQHTYPHIDMPAVGVQAAEQLLALMADPGAIAPKLVRVRVPALVRGDNMVTAPHANVGYVDSLMQRVIALEAEPGVIAAALCWGNPFTDVPELLSQVLVLVDSNSPAKPEAKARAAAESIAAGFWDGRAQMQATPGGDEKPFLSLPAAVAAAQAAVDAGSGTVILTDAADATSSGASGNGASILAELVRQGYTGRALVPLVDPAAVAAAFAAGVGRALPAGTLLGGSFDARFTAAGAPGFQGGPGSAPRAHEGPYLGVTAEQRASLLLADGAVSAVVTALSDGEAVRQRWNWGGPGLCCTLQLGSVTVAVISNPVVLMTDDVFLGLGHDPKHFDAVVIKTPHAQPEMFDDWAFTNLGVDTPGATTADVSALGHTIARTPRQQLYPMDAGMAYQPLVETVEMALALTLAEAEAR